MTRRISLREFQERVAARLREAAGGMESASKLGMQVGDEAWLVELADVAEVVPVTELTPVPHTQPWFRGIANVRGTLYSVVDFADFLGAGPTPASEQNRLVLLHGRFAVNAALLVGRMLGLRHREQLVPQPAAAAPWEWVRAQYADSQGMRWRELAVRQLVRAKRFLEVGT